jgi:hypothetical protein
MNAEGYKMARPKECPSCGYVNQTDVAPGSYRVCNGCLVPIHVNADKTFTVVTMRDVPPEFKEDISALSGLEIE